jgi:hypothetical protein
MHSRDSVAEWFLRLNGFFTVLNFVVHPVERAEGTRQRTDADVLGIRFPHRQEIVGGRPLVDHKDFRGSSRPVLVIAEVKAGRCRLNGPWTRSEDGNVGSVLRSLGCVEPESLKVISDSLYECGCFESTDFEIRLVCFGARLSTELPTGALQFLWSDVFGFVYDRYQEFWRVKRDNQQWPPIGGFLWDKCKGQKRDVYVQEMLNVFSVAAL